MNKYVEATGKTIDEAIAAGKKMLGVEDDALVSYEVLEIPKSGFLGIGGTPAKVAVSLIEAESAGSVEEFLTTMLDKMGADAKIESKLTDEGNIAIELIGENMGMLIGRRGETLDAIQHIANLVANKGREEHVRVMVDTENYRAKRAETLESLAKKVAGQVLKYKRNKVLEPMNAYERHIIHAALQDVENVSTSSTGVEPNRRVVVNYTGSDAGSYRRPYRPRYNNK
ncbi:MAG: protein jag [Clostridia bacterium]|nr:protein jag [Clostridia bacterium]